MGFAASQARLLLLTARKSDLEFRAQQITNSEMILAMQTEEVARDYSMKLSNQTIRYQNADGDLVPLTAENFSDLTGCTLEKFQDGDWQKCTPGEVVTYRNGETTLTQEEYDKLEDKTGYEMVKQINDNFNGQQLIRGFNNRTLRAMKDGQEVDIINTDNNAVVSYDTSDDAAADAEYRQKTAALQVKEKRLQMELQQVEAQQKACESELDSVKKIMDKNIDRTFKVFS